VYPFIDPVTAAKIKFIYGKAALQELRDAIEPKVVMLNNKRDCTAQ
jgi:hypothetical protein